MTRSAWKRPNDDEALASRYVDGMLQGDALVRFERRLLADADLRAAVDGQQQTRQWFAARRADDAHEPDAVVSPGFADAVLARTRRLPSRAELLAEQDPLVERELAAVARTARLLLIAAAVMFGLSMLVWGGLLQRPDPRHLEASDLDRIQQIDHAIERDKLRQSPGRGR